MVWIFDVKPSTLYSALYWWSKMFYSKLKNLKQLRETLRRPPSIGMWQFGCQLCPNKAILCLFVCLVTNSLLLVCVLRISEQFITEIQTKLKLPPYYTENSHIDKRSTKRTISDIFEVKENSRNMNAGKEGELCE